MAMIYYSSTKNSQVFSLLGILPQHTIATNLKTINL